MRTTTTTKTTAGVSMTSPFRSVAPTRDTQTPGIEDVQFLLVDDYDFVRRIVTEGLKGCGAKKIHGAQDGKEAILYLRHRAPRIRDTILLDMMDTRPDIAEDLSPESVDFKTAHSYCVVTDFSMKNGNGLEVLKAIRCGETSVPRSTPVILLTGYSDDFVVAAALDLDVNAFIVKPVSRITLQEKVDRVLRSALEVKDVSVYTAIEIPDEHGQIIGGRAATRASKTAQDDEDEIRWLPIMAIQPGAILAEDLRTERGALLLQAGTVLNEFTLQRLRDVADAKGLSGNIPIQGGAAHDQP